ncbi:MAG: hypothetical protein E6Q98_08655 [Rhodospirillaceae bacterium]|nr:MAG: hypothetical protein E6Q98_08655 [Rhodospirillaceae bacterium]
MRIHLFSDLHLEFAPLELPESVRSGQLAELVLLAGDIHTKRRAPNWAAQTFTQPVALVGGNHEAYQDSLFASIAAHRRAAADAARNRSEPIRYLEREIWTFTAKGGVPIRILGGTLWTDSELMGLARRPEMMSRALSHMNDYHYIKVRYGYDQPVKLSSHDTAGFFALTKKFLIEELTKPFDGVTIVMTHHAPSGRSLPEKERSDDLASCYASNLDEFIETHQPDLWVHGHIHSSSDYYIGRTRIVCNPRGYAPSYLNRNFDTECVIELG